jgi:hypothetical protein
MPDATDDASDDRRDDTPDDDPTKRPAPAPGEPGPGTVAQEADPEIGPGTHPDADVEGGETPTTPDGRP